MTRPNAAGLGPRAVLDDLAATAATQASKENFPVALRVLPRQPREHLARFYDYARFVDDVGDEAPGNRRVLLDMVADDVRALWGGRPVLMVVAALRPTVQQCAIPSSPFLDLIEANRIDQDKTHYASYADLMSYCRLSADPIGRVVLYIAGAVTEPNLTDSDSVCSALQVLEHCQDVGEDARRGRVYLPADEISAASVDPAELTSGVTGAALRSVVAQQVDRAEAALQSGRALVRRLRGWARIAVAGYVGGGLATVDALREADFDVLGGAVRPSKRRTAAHALRLVAGPR